MKRSFLDIESRKFQILTSLKIFNEAFTVADSAVSWIPDSEVNGYRQQLADCQKTIEKNLNERLWEIECLKERR